MENEKKIRKGLLSVVIPVYNIGGYVERCVRSVLAQPDLPLEVLLVDDGSTDDSGAVCDALAAEDARITVLHKQNGGLRVEVGRHLYRTGFLRANGLQFRKGILHEDEEFTPRVLLLAQRVVLTGQVVYHYDNCRAGSITNAESLSTRRVQDRLDIYDELAAIYSTVTPRALRRRLQDDLCWKYLDCAARFDCRTLPGCRPQRLRMLQFACTPRRRAKALLFALSPELFRRVMNH